MTYRPDPPDTTHFDALETRAPEIREAELMEAVRAQVTHARAKTKAFASSLNHVDVGQLNTRADLATVPVARKSNLIGLQAQARPFGGLTAAPLAEMGRVFQSPGPIYEPQARRADYWRMARALFAAGIRPGDLVHNTFSYHFTPAGSMMESGADALGCTVFPAGVGQTELQVRAIADLRPRAYVGTPSFLDIILQKADELGENLDSIQNALVSGEALPNALRGRFQTRGIQVLQAYATADLGLIAYETPALEGMVCDEQVLVEIVRPGTGEPVAEGVVGEVVVTTLNPDYPLIRFGTGDLSAILPGVSPCGRTNMRIRGWLGRADQTTKIRGMFVHPEQVDQVVKRHPEIRQARLVVSNPDQRDQMTLLCDFEKTDPGLLDRIADTVREVTKLRGLVAQADGALPNDGRVIDDQRSYD
jgi:phenylacetate-CoA ligase